jgi:hypothetical protein
MPHGKRDSQKENRASMKIYLSAESARHIDLGPEPQGHRPPRTPKPTLERPRQRFPICETTGKRRLSEHAAKRHVEAAAKLRNSGGKHLPQWEVKRYYFCKDCEDFHLTSKPKGGKK